MNCLKMDDILSIYHSKENKRKLTKEEQNIYLSEIRSMLSSNEFEDAAIHYVIAGPLNLGIRGYMEWYQTLTYEKQIETMEKILTCKMMTNLPTVRRFKTILIMFSEAVSTKAMNNVVIGQLLSWVDELSFTKEGNRISDLGKVFKSSFLNSCRLEETIPSIDKYGFSGEYEKRLRIFFEEVFSIVEVDNPDEKKKIELLQKWLLPVIEIKESVEMEQGTEVVNDSLNKNNENKTNSLEMEKVKNKEEVNENCAKLKGKTAIRIYELAQIVDTMENVANNLSKESKKKDKKIASLQVQLNNSVGKNQSLEMENAELRSKLIEQQSEIEAIKAEKSEMSARIERQSSVLDVFQEDKANSQTEQLNSLAASLVRLYKEFETAQSMDLTTDLEMTLLDLVEDIFRRLEKNGVDVKGRL